MLHLFQRQGRFAVQLGQPRSCSGTCLWVEYFEERRRYLDQYLAEIRPAAIVRQDEEKALLAAARGGDEQAKKRAIESYLALTAHLALKFSPADVDGLDVIQEAQLALIRLIDDPTVSEVAHVLPAAVHDAVRRVVEWTPPIPVGTRDRYIGPPLSGPHPRLPPLIAGQVGSVEGFSKDDDTIVVEWDQLFGTWFVPLTNLEFLDE